MKKEAKKETKNNEPLFVTYIHEFFQKWLSWWNVFIFYIKGIRWVKYCWVETEVNQTAKVMVTWNTRMQKYILTQLWNVRSIR